MRGHDRTLCFDLCFFFSLLCFLCLCSLLPLSLEPEGNAQKGYAYTGNASELVVYIFPIRPNWFAGRTAAVVAAALVISPPLLATVLLVLIGTHDGDSYF